MKSWLSAQTGNMKDGAVSGKVREITFGEERKEGRLNKM